MAAELATCPVVRVVACVCRAPGDPLESVVPCKVNMLPRDWMEDRIDVCAEFFRWTRKRKHRIVWIRPFVFLPDTEVSLTFPWVDTWRETRPILEALAGDWSGSVYSDVDQGWDVSIDRADGLLTIRMGEPGDEQSYETYDVDAAPYAEAAREELVKAPEFFHRLARKAWPNPIIRYLRSPYRS